MDPASAAGLAIGVASLVFEVFDSSVKGFKFLSLMVDMPKDCKHCQLKLVIEYNRLLAWGKAVGLISAAEDSDVAASLGTNAVELCGILSRITWLLEEFKEVNNRWKIETPDGIPDHDTLDASDVSEMVSNLEFAYEETKSKEVYKRVRKQSRLKQWMSKLVADAKDIGSHPSRIRWAMVDKSLFEELLEDLRFLTDRLYQLLVEHRQKRVADITAETYRELVLTRTNVEELKAMLEAINSLMVDSPSLKANCHVVNDRAFRDLLRLKEINRTADTILAMLNSDDRIDVNVAWKGLIKAREYDGATFRDYFIYSDENDYKTAGRVTRARGALICDGSALESWVEWRYNEKGASETTRNKTSRLRVMTLAQMLHSTKPSELYAPNCIGFIDDVTDNDRYGWLFEMPGGSKKEDKLKTLHSLLGQGSISRPWESGLPLHGN